jgi:hypothetical protein
MGLFTSLDLAKLNFKPKKYFKQLPGERNTMFTLRANEGLLKYQTNTNKDGELSNKPNFRVPQYLFPSSYPVRDACL